MELYNDSNKEYELLLGKDKDGKPIIGHLGIKKTIEVSDELGKKLLGIKAYRGLKDAESMTPARKTRDAKRIEALEAENKKLLEELAELKGEKPEGDPLEKMTVSELEAYAAEKEIDLGNAKKKREILAMIQGA